VSADARALVALLLLMGGPLAAQDESSWELGGEMGASLFYGSSEQFALTLRTEAGYEDGAFDFAAKTGFDYGEATDDTEGRFVSNRGWSTEVSVDYDEGDWAPFVKVGSRGSLQRRLDNRTSVGAGTRYRIVRNDRSRVDLSMSLAAERTDPAERTGEENEITTKGRWSGLFRAQHTFGAERMTFDFSSEYEPGLQRFREDYVVDTEASLGIALTEAVRFQIIFENTYDSLAGDRGATSNSDGRVFFLVGASIG